MGQSEHRSTTDDPIRQVQRAAAVLAARMKPLASVRAGSASALGDLERALDALGDPGTFTGALEDTAGQAQELVRAGRAARADNLRSAVAGFIRNAELGQSARETALGWRVGRVALELRADEGSLRASYNREPMTAWLPVHETADVERIYKDAEILLNKAEMPLEFLAPTLVAAYEDVGNHMSAAAGTPRRVKLQDVLEEVRIIRVREALRARKRKDAEAAIGMPAWSLLYNTDRYRAAAATLSPGARLMFEPGTTAEGTKFGVTLNGLEASRDYQRFCYVRRVTGE